MLTNNYHISHLAIIMDGNQRWAIENNLSSEKGYLQGLNKLIEVIDFCIKKKIANLSVYALSTENTQRNSIGVIYKIIRNKYIQFLDILSNEKKINIKIIGEKNNIPSDIISIFDKIKVQNKKPSLNLNIAFNYGTSNEVISIIKKILNDKIKYDQINIKLIKDYMYLGDSPDPEILIRTGGFQRLSNFILLNMSYTELFFTKSLWPEFSVNELENILKDYQTIIRKYGL